MIDRSESLGEQAVPPAIAIAETPEGGLRARRAELFGLVTMTTVLFPYFAAAAAPSPLLPLLMEEWSFAPWLLTFAFAIYAIAILAALLVVGRLSDHVGRRPVVLVATGLELAAMLLFSAADDIGGMVLARAVQGLATGAATGALSASIADFSGSSRSRLAATLSSAGPLAGLATGAVFAGAAAAGSNDPKAPVFLVFAALFALALLAVVAARESSSRRDGALRSLRPRVAVPPAARRAFWRATPVAVAVWMTGGFSLSVVGEISRSLLAVEEALASSLLIAALFVVGTIAVVVGRRLSVRGSAVLGVSLIAAGVLCDILAVQSGSAALLVVGVVTAGCGFGLAFAGAVGLVIPHARPHERGELFSAIYVVNYLAFGVPAIVAGLLIEPWGLATAVTLYAAVIAAVAVIGVVAQTTRSREEASHRPARPFPPVRK